jgi:SPP1 family predicted phage head-tail adaptor
MRAGPLRHVITIQSPPAGTPSDMGTPSGSWTAVYSNIRAQISPIKGNEFFKAQQVNSEIDVKIVIRYHSGILPQYRVVWGSRYFQIIDVINSDMRNIMLELMCKEIPAGAS